MKLLTPIALLLLSYSAFAYNLLECKPREGKFETRDIVVGNVVIQKDEVILFQQAPVFETVTFDVKKAETQNSRTGSWTTYTLERELDQEIITLQIEDAGKVRRAYLTRENTPFADEYFFDLIPLKCTEI